VGQAPPPVQPQQVTSTTVTTGTAAVSAPMVLYPSQQPSRYENYQFKSARALGIAQIVCGVLCFIFQIAAIAVGATAAFVAPGIWCGILFVIAGCLGVASASSKTACTIVATMVLSIISSVFVFNVLIVAAVALGVDNDCHDYHYYDYYYPYREECNKPPKLAMSGILLLLSIVELIASIWASVLCCSAVCCGRRMPSQTTVMYTSGGVQYPGQVVVMNSGANPMIPQGGIAGGVVYTTTYPTQPTVMTGYPGQVVIQNQQASAPGQVPGQVYNPGQPVNPPPYAAGSAPPYQTPPPAGSVGYQPSSSYPTVAPLEPPGK